MCISAHILPRETAEFPCAVLLAWGFASCHKEPSRLQALPSTLGKPQHSPSTAGTVTSTMACLAYSHSCPSPWPASSQAHSMQVHSSPSPVHTCQAICAHLARHPGLHVHHSSHPNAPQQPSADTLSVGCPSFPANFQLPTSAAGGSSKGSSCPLGLRSQFPARLLGEGHFPRHLSQASGRAGLKARPISCLSSSAPHPIPVFLGQDNQQLLLWEAT